MTAPIGSGASPPGGDWQDTLDALRNGRGGDERQRLKTATQLLEGSFYLEMFKAMRKTVPEGGIIEGGRGEDVFADMLDEHLAEAAASRAEGGLADALYRRLVGALRDGA